MTLPAYIVSKARNAELNAFMQQWMLRELHEGLFDSAPVDLLDWLERFLDRPRTYERNRLIHQLRLAGDYRRFCDLVEYPVDPPKEKRRKRAEEVKLTAASNVIDLSSGEARVVDVDLSLPLGDLLELIPWELRALVPSDWSPHWRLPRKVRRKWREYMQNADDHASGGVHVK